VWIATPLLVETPFEGGDTGIAVGCSEDVRRKRGANLATVTAARLRRGGGPRRWQDGEVRPRTCLILQGVLGEMGVVPGPLP